MQLNAIFAVFFRDWVPRRCASTFEAPLPAACGNSPGGSACSSTVLACTSVSSAEAARAERKVALYTHWCSRVSPTRLVPSDGSYPERVLAWVANLCPSLEDGDVAEEWRLDLRGRVRKRRGPFS